MSSAPASTHDETQIRQLIEAQASAIAVKDVDAIMAPYAADAIIFDCKPPFQTRGADAWRRVWEECLAYFPDAFGIERRDLHVSVSGDTAVAHGLYRFTGMPKGHPAMQTWLRITTCYQRRHGCWQIVHEHYSVPFDPETSQAVFSFEP